MLEVLRDILIPFFGTFFGAATVFFFKKGMRPAVQKAFSGFAAGVMVAASIWSLIIPSIEQGEHMGILSFIPVTVGIWVGFAFLMLLDRIIPHLHVNNTAEGPESNLRRSTKMILAVALHNLPEGMAVGVALASLTHGQNSVSSATTLALSLGIAIQNFPEGAIISVPLHEDGISKKKAFLYGALSGVVEPLGALITLIIAGLVVPMLPYFLSFAAGAMLYVVVEELIPAMSEGEHSHTGTVFFFLGFSLMLILDIILK